MPIKDKAKRRERDRERSRRRYSAERLARVPRDKARFGQWLKCTLIETGVSLRVLADELALDQRDLLRVREGLVESLPAKTFAIGAALHACGVAWCSGPVALFESNHHAELVDFIAALAAVSPRKAARVIAALAELAPTLLQGVREKRIDREWLIEAALQYVPGGEPAPGSRRAALAQGFVLVKSAAEKDRLQHVIRVMTGRVAAWNAYQSALDPYEDEPDPDEDEPYEDEPYREFPRAIWAAISVVPPMSERKCHPLLTECYDGSAYAAAWARAIGSNTAAKNQRNAATELKIARVLACSKDDLSAQERQRRVIEALTAWVVHHDSPVVDDGHYQRWAESRAITEAMWVSPERLETFSAVLLEVAKMKRSSTHGTGRGRNVH
jgi:hypothetical protein